MSVPLLAIGPAPLALEPLLAAVTDRGDASGTDGAVATFIGLTRDHHQGRRVRYLDYDAYDALALRSFARITEEVDARWAGVRLGIHHRTGRVDVGIASVMIVAASPHRGKACAACRFAIERLKQISPIWKHEYFEDGEAWVEGATANPEDAEALAAAERVSCA